MLKYIVEHDSYRNSYENYEEAMRSVCIAPYEEDPFDLMQMLDEEYDLRQLYPELGELIWKADSLSPFAREYIERMAVLWQK